MFLHRFRCMFHLLSFSENSALLSFLSLSRLNTWIFSPLIGLLSEPIFPDTVLRKDPAGFEPAYNHCLCCTYRTARFFRSPLSGICASIKSLLLKPYYCSENKRHMRSRYFLAALPLSYGTSSDRSRTDDTHNKYLRRIPYMFSVKYRSRCVHKIFINV